MAPSFNASPPPPITVAVDDDGNNDDEDGSADGAPWPSKRVKALGPSGEGNRQSGVTLVITDAPCPECTYDNCEDAVACVMCRCALVKPRKLRKRN